uniref:Uncharacterized protein n=1 Tax=Knipowitschia caucasica TaxID=637954 RepID=A0AAV2JJX5_KNICA
MMLVEFEARARSAAAFFLLRFVSYSHYPRALRLRLRLAREMSECQLRVGRLGCELLLLHTQLKRRQCMQ